MFTKNFYKLFSTICKISAALGVVGFTFDPIKRRVFTTPGQIRKSQIQLLGVLIHVIYFLFRMFQMTYWNGGKSHPDFHIVYVYTLAVIMELGGLLIIHRRSDELVTVINQMLRHMVEFTAKWRPDYKPGKELFSLAIDVLLFLLILAATGGGGLAPLFYLLFPKSPAHFLSLLPDSVGFGWFIFFWFLNLLDTIQLSLLICYSLTIFITVAIIYFFSAFPIIWRQFRGGLPKDKYKTVDAGVGIPWVDGLRTAEHLSHEYHCLELIHKGLMRSAGLIFIHFQLCFAQFGLVCNYSVIKQWHQLDTLTTLMLLMYSATVQITWAIVLDLSGRFHHHAKLTLASWRYLSHQSRLDKKFMSKFRKGCYPLAIGERGLFIVRKISVLKFLRGIVKGTFRALLTVGQKS